MRRAWQSVLRRYGLEVTLVEDGTERTVRAFLQPVREKSGAEPVPEPYGMRSGTRWLYFGPEDAPLCAGRTRVWRGTRRFLVCRACLTEGSHWWALLRPEDEEGEA